MIRQLLDEEGTTSAAQFRDALQTGRKAAIVLLEYFDRILLTQREENIRKPGVRYKDVYI
jgi:selenocysteine-specific elongation factor